MPLEDRLRGRNARDLRRERDELGFVRQPPVRWMDPGLLSKSGVEVVVSATFGKFSDKREIQRETQAGLDYSRKDELWVDYLSDTGDGWDATYTMAWLLARESLDVDGDRLPRAEVLLLGGDQVYPAADPVAYENRFIGPFAAARPKTRTAHPPHLYALPGNHDWYDGLGSFLRVFCARDGRIGEWATRQRRSYFALKLPHGWWVWGIDIQLDTYIDDVQLEYFREQPVQRGDKIVLLTAKPAWIKALAGRVEPPSWRYLSFFEERVVRASGARLVATITGDLHHYARYEPRDDDAPTRLTAGGGGAYLSGTHTLEPELRLRSLDHDETDTVTYAREQIYPRAEDSRRMSAGILRLAVLNPAFARMFGVVYLGLGVAMLGALNSGAGALADKATGHGFWGFLAGAAGAVSVILAVVLFLAILMGTEIVPPPLQRRPAVVHGTQLVRLAVALAHTALQLALVGLVLWGVSELARDEPLLIWGAGLLALFAAGTLLGTTLLGACLLAIHRARGAQAGETANYVFTGQSIPDYKNLLRMHFAGDGTLTIHPLGVERVGRDWRYVRSSRPQPRFVPGETPPAVHRIDVPLRYGADGHRVR